MDKMIRITTAGIVLLSLFLVLPAKYAKGAPPVSSEESVKEEAAKEKEQETEKEKKKSPEEEKKNKDEKELKANINDIRKRQEKDEASIKVRANVFPSTPPEADCTGADKARSRLQEVGDQGGVVIKGDLKIDTKNENHVEKNEGTINSQTSINITNDIKHRC